MIRIYNTMSKRKEDFVPLKEGKVGMYVCGPTVYNLIHIGNARPMIVFDTVRRYLEYRGYEVNFVSNFTDVDDKIINKAKEEGVDAGVFAGNPVFILIKAVRAAARAFRANPAFKTEDAIMELGVGEALVSFLDEDGETLKAANPRMFIWAVEPENAAIPDGTQRNRCHT